MSHSSDAITAVGAIVREALIDPPVGRQIRTEFTASPATTYMGERLVATSGAIAKPGIVELQLTVKLSDLLAALSPAELQGLAEGNLHISFAGGLTDDAGALLNYTGHAEYVEAQSLFRTGISAPAKAWIQAQRRIALGVATINPNVWRPGDLDGPIR